MPSSERRENVTSRLHGYGNRGRMWDHDAYSSYPIERTSGDGGTVLRDKQGSTFWLFLSVSVGDF